MRKSTLVLLIAMVIASALQAQKNDTVYLNNGDKITGELKKFDNGTFTVSTDGMGTINIEYEKIKTVYSGKNFEVIDNAGFSVYGSIGTSVTPGTVELIVLNGTVPRQIREIVQMIPIKNKFWKKFYGSVDLGASYYKSTDILQYNFSTSINHRSKGRLITLDMSSIYTDQRKAEGSNITKKNDLLVEYTRFYSGKWWLGGGAKAQQNTEMDLDYRLQAGLMGGYDLVHTNPIRFLIMSGVLANKEKSLDTASISSNLEGLLSLQFSWLQHNNPDVKITSGLNFYPSLTISQRYRVESELSVKIEVVSDLYFGVTFYDNFDSKPLNSQTALNDWGNAISIGYSF